MTKHQEKQPEKPAEVVEEKKDPVQFQPKKRWKKVVAIVAILILIPALGVAGLFGYEYAYRDKVYEGVLIAVFDGQGTTQVVYDAGGKTKQQLIQFFKNLDKKYHEQGIVLQVTTASGTLQKIPLKTRIVTSDNQLEIAHFDVDFLVQGSFSQGRSDDPLINFLKPVLIFFQKRYVSSGVVFNTEVFNDHIRELLAPYENPSHNARIEISSLKPLSYQIVPEKSGLNFDYQALEKMVKNRLEKLSFDPITISATPTAPLITSAEVDRAAASIPTLLATPITLVYEDTTSSISQKWKLTPEQLSKWLVPVRQSDLAPVSFGIDVALAKDYLESNISKYINQQPRNAIFRMEGDRVVEFQGSRTGLKTDLAATVANINNLLATRAQGADMTSTTVVVQAIEPDITVGKANNLGITDIVGVGVSLFKGSPTNRIKNIATGVKRLNGVLIKPGEVFSTNKYSRGK